MSIEATLARGRAAAESLMSDSCTIQRAFGEPYLPPGAGEYVQDMTTVYAGKCRVQSAGLVSRERDAGEQFTIVGRPTVAIPIGSPSVAQGDLVTVTAAVFNPQIVGAKYRVRSIQGKSQPTSVRLECEEA